MKKQMTVAEAKQALTEATEARRIAYAVLKAAEQAEFAARDEAKKMADRAALAQRIKHRNTANVVKTAERAAAKAVEAKAALVAAKDGYEMAQAAEDKAEDTLAEAVDQAAVVQPEPVEVTETQEEETMNEYDPYAQDRADGEAQEKREQAIWDSIDTGAAPRPTKAQIEAAIAADANTAPQTAGDPNSDLTAMVAADEAETVYVRDWLMDTPQSNGEAFVLTANRPDGLRWVADRANGGIAIGRYNNVGYGPELPDGYDWRPAEVDGLRWYAVDDE